MQAAKKLNSALVSKARGQGRRCAASSELLSLARWGRAESPAGPLFACWAEPLSPLPLSSRTVPSRSTGADRSPRRAWFFARWGGLAR